MSCKVIGILDSIDLYGKERANLQVYRLLKKYDYNILLVINKKASPELKRETSDFDTIQVDFPRGIEGKFIFFRYLRCIISSNYSVFKVLVRQCPRIILIPTEIELLFLFLPLLFSKAKIIFRMGDDPLTYRKRDNLITKVYAVIWKNIILRRVNSVVCISKYIQDRLVESGRNIRSNDIIIYNYPPERVYSHDEKLHKVVNQKLKVGFIGRIVPDKGVFLLIKAVGNLLEEGIAIELYVAGDLSSDLEYSRNLTSFVNNINVIKDNIHFLDIVYNTNRFYRETIDIICVPSIYEEPLSNVLVESKMFSKPSIIFNSGGMPEIITHKHDGYICKDMNVESLKEALIFYYESPQYVTKHGNNAFNSIAKLGIDKDSFERKWHTLFSEVSSKKL